MQLSELLNYYWPPVSAHREHWEDQNYSLVYEYDPTDDGPEWYTLRVILANHTPEELDEERRDSEARHVAHLHAKVGSITSRYYV